MRLVLMVQVCAAHAVSHFHMMALPALVPILPERYNASFVEIGTAITLFAVVSLFAHIPIGHVTDRIGPRPVLVAGLCLGSVSLASLAWFDSYAWLLVAMVGAGAANGVYHPGGYAMISRGIKKRKAGRAFSYYTFSGFFGSAATPALVYGAIAIGSMEFAFLVIALMGGAAVLLFLIPDQPLPAAPKPESTGDSKPAGLFTPQVRLLSVVFVLLSLIAVGTQNFSAAALAQGYGVDLATANIALSALLFASAFGVLAGGMVADRARYPGLTAATSLAVLTVTSAALAWSVPGAAVIVAMMTLIGLAFGFVAPSRDLLVRAAAPSGAEGRVFAIVSTGFNVGGAAGPLMFGWVLDHGMPWHVFAITAALGVAAVTMTALSR